MRGIRRTGSLPGCPHPPLAFGLEDPGARPCSVGRDTALGGDGHAGQHKPAAVEQGSGLPFTGKPRVSVRPDPGVP